MEAIKTERITHSSNLIILLRYKFIYQSPVITKCNTFTRNRSQFIYLRNFKRSEFAYQPIYVIWKEGNLHINQLKQF